MRRLRDGVRVRVRVVGGVGGGGDGFLRLRLGNRRLRLDLRLGFDRRERPRAKPRANRARRVLVFLVPNLRVGGGEPRVERRRAAVHPRLLRRRRRVRLRQRHLRPKQRSNLRVREIHQILRGFVLLPGRVLRDGRGRGLRLRRRRDVSRGGRLGGGFGRSTSTSPRRGFRDVLLHVLLHLLVAPVRERARLLTLFLVLSHLLAFFGVDAALGVLGAEAPVLARRVRVFRSNLHAVLPGHERAHGMIRDAAVAEVALDARALVALAAHLALEPESVGIDVVDAAHGFHRLHVLDVRLRQPVRTEEVRPPVPGRGLERATFHRAQAASFRRRALARGLAVAFARSAEPVSGGHALDAVAQLMHRHVAPLAIQNRVIVVRGAVPADMARLG